MWIGLSVAALGMHVDVYGGTRHSNIVKALVHQSCHVCKWPIHTVDATQDIKHPLVKSYAMSEAAVVVAIDGNTLYMPHSYKTLVVIGRNETAHDVRSLKSRFSTVHFFPTTVHPTPFAKGFDVQCDPHALAHVTLLSLLRW